MLYGNLLCSSKSFKDSKMDYLYDIGGKRINKSWYFFFTGVSTVLPREGIQDSIYSPFTFAELSYLAYDQSFRILVKNVLNDRPGKNQAFFSKRFGAIEPCDKTDELLPCLDSIIPGLSKEKYKHKLQDKEIRKIFKYIRESKRPIYKVNENINTPLFESTVWKEYLKSR